MNETPDMDDNNWRKCIVADIVAPIKNALVGGPFGSNLISRDYTPVGVPVIRGQNMGFGRWVSGEFVFVSLQKADDLSGNIAREGDLIFTQRGTLGQVAIVPPKPYEKYVISQSQMKLSADKSKANVMFLYYLFSSQEHQEYIRQNAIQTGVPHTNLEHLRNTPLYLPPLSEQQKIVRILGSLDDKIELNRQMNETLETMARAIFQSWFVDFDPVRAKADGRQPAGMDTEMAALFPEGLEVVDGREVPKGWPIGILGEIVELRTDRIEVNAERNNLRYIALNDIPSKSLDLSYYQFGSDVNSSIIAFGKGDILFGSMRPYFHKVGLTFFDGITRTTTFVLRPRKKVFRHYSLFTLFSEDVVSFATTASVGTTIPYVKWDALQDYSIVIPPEPLLDVFEKTVCSLIEKIGVNGEQSRTLAQIRDELLPKLLSGEISVDAKT
jgi:Restriction endonuclease S subunits